MSFLKEKWKGKKEKKRSKAKTDMAYVPTNLKLIKYLIAAVFFFFS